MFVDSYHLNTHGMSFCLPELPLKVFLRRQRDLEMVEVPFEEKDQVLTLRFEDIAAILPQEVTRYDILVSTKGNVEAERSFDTGVRATESKLTRLDVKHFSALPLWKRFYRSPDSLTQLQPHIYINRKGFFSVVMRSAIHVDHGERLFPYTHEITDIRFIRNRLHASIGLEIDDAESITVERCYLKLDSSDEIIELNSRYVVDTNHSNISIRARIDIPQDLLPLRYALFATVKHSDFNTPIELRISHIGRGLFANMNSKFFAPQMFLSGDRLLTVATNPGTTGMGFLVRPRSTFDNHRTRMRFFRFAGEIDNRLRRFLGVDTKPAAFLYERECSTAQDNGYALFQHLSENRESAKFNYSYFMDPASPQWKRTSGYKNVVKKYSYKYWRIITSPTSFGVTSEGRFHLGALYSSSDILTRLAYNRKSYFLQHGVTAFKKVNFFKPETATFPDGFVVTAEWEKQILLESGVPEWKIDVIGFPRWDKLTSGSETPREVRQIVYMPTWRPWLEGRNADELANSSYVEEIERFLESADLHKLLEQYDARIQFIPHPKFKDLSSHFQGALSRVEVMDQDKVEFSELISQASMIITDYSSIAWEFVQSRKPVLLFQFDLERYDSTVGKYHNTELDKVRRRYPTAYEPSTLIRQIHALLESDAPTVAETADDFCATAFAFHDKQNSARAVESINRRLPALSSARRLPTYDEADVPYQRRLVKLKQVNTP